MSTFFNSIFFLFFMRSVWQVSFYAGKIQNLFSKIVFTIKTWVWRPLMAKYIGHRIRELEKPRLFLRSSTVGALRQASRKLGTDGRSSAHRLTEALSPLYGHALLVRQSASGTCAPHAWVAAQRLCSKNVSERTRSPRHESSPVNTSTCSPAECDVNSRNGTGIPWGTIHKYTVLSCPAPCCAASCFVSCRLCRWLVSTSGINQSATKSTRRKARRTVG